MDEAKPTASKLTSKITSVDLAHQHDEIAAGIVARRVPGTLGANARFILRERILLRTASDTVVEDFDGLCTRVGNAVGGKKRGAEYAQLLRSLDFVPNSPCLTNAGKPKMSMSACFVLPADDSVEDVFQCVKWAAMVHKSGGGTGFSGARIRPRGSIVGSTGGIASGPVSILFQVVNDGTEQIKQGSTRRGANMGIIPVWHPDILFFIRYKAVDGKLKNFNISVAVTDEFMAQLDRDPHAVHVTRFGEKRYAIRKKDAANVELTPIPGGSHMPPAPSGEWLTVGELWNEIVERAFENGEPGLFFIDEVNRKNAGLLDLADTASPSYIEAPNPCQPAWAPTLTPSGIRQFGQVNEGDAIWSGKRWTRVRRKWATGIAKVYAYHTRAGTFFGTEKHRVLSEGEKIEVENALSIDISIGSSSVDLLQQAAELDPCDIMDGLVFGDGSKHRASNDLVYLCIGEKDRDYHESEVRQLVCRHRPGLHNTAWEVVTTITAAEIPYTFLRRVPSRFFYGDFRKVRGFLRGLYSANGSVAGGRVTLKAASFGAVVDVQAMLSAIGIASYYTTNDAHTVEFSNGAYECKKSYDLNITTGRGAFSRLIGFIQRDKQSRLDEVCARLPSGLAMPKKTSYEIVGRSFVSEEMVFDWEVEDEEHTYWTGGLHVSNCGEQPLAPFDACTLGSLNVSRMVRQNGKVEVDWDLFDVRVRQGVRFLNDVLDNNYYPIAEITEVTRKNRKIGLGIMGWADLLLRLGISYAEPASWEFGDKLAARLEEVAWDESFRIASERGAGYPAFGDGEAFFRVHPRLREVSKKYGGITTLGPMNMAISSIAPTGTISAIAGCSSSIEPVYAWAFVQRRIDTVRAEIHPLVEEVLGAEACVELRVSAAEAHPGSPTKQVGWMNRQLEPRMRAIGPAYVVARDVPVEAHLEHQAAFQRHMTDAVSKTINFANEKTVEDVDRAYRWAHKNGLKGITVYREGSRKDEVLSTGLSSLDETVKSGRPDILPAVVIRDKIEVSPGEFQFTYVTVGLLGAKITGGRPFEVFMAGDPRVDPQVAQGIDTCTRLVSTSLRHGVAVNVIVKQLDRIRGQRIFSLPRKVGHALLRSLAFATDVPESESRVLEPCDVLVSGEVCGGQRVFREGCYRCEKCFATKCG